MSSKRFSQEQLRPELRRQAKAQLAGNGRVVRLLKTADPVISEPRQKKDRSPAEETLAMVLEGSDLPKPVRQYRYLSDRRFKADFAWPETNPPFACEVDGAVHRIKGSFQRSFEREFLLKKAGWQVLHVGTEQIRSGEAMEWIRALCPGKA